MGMFQRARGMCALGLGVSGALALAATAAGVAPDHGSSAPWVPGLAGDPPSLDMPAASMGLSERTLVVRVDLGSFDDASGRETLLDELRSAYLGPDIIAIQPLVHSFEDPEAAARSGIDQFYLFTLRAHADAPDVAARIVAGSRFVTAARPEYFARLVSPAPEIEREPSFGSSGPDDNPGVAPVNDPFFPQQWALQNTGQDVSATPGDPGADIDAPGAWSFVPAQSDVVVALLDTGVSPTHPDLADQLVPGFNAADGDPTDTDDGALSHGTSTAGVLAARTDNEIGIAGAAPFARIMPVRIFNSFGFGFEVEFVAGLMHAADNGAAVISMSLGYPFDTDAMQAAVRYASERDIVLIASTGNTPGQAVQFPASMAETIAVGATDNKDELWSNSTTGPQITLVAPGVRVLTTWDTPSQPGEYRTQSGTSIAVPHVSAIASMIRAVNPDLTAEEVSWVLVNSCVDLGEPGWDESYGYGRVNAHTAILLAISLGPVQCLADINGDGMFNVEDIDAFKDAFDTRDPVADLAPPFGTFNTNDIEAFADAALSDDCDG